MNSLPWENLFNFVLSLSLWGLFKILVSFSLFLYVLFAVVVVRQVSLMLKTLGGQLELPLRLVAAIHLAGAIFIFVLALVIL